MRRRRDYEDEPRRMPPWAVGLVIGACVLLVAFAGLRVAFWAASRGPTAPPTAQEPDGWAVAKPTVIINGVKVEALWSGLANIGGNRFGQFKNYGPAQSIQFRLENTSDRKIVRFLGWHENSKTVVEDEHGNRYPEFSIPGGFGFFEHPGPKKSEGCDDSSIIARVVPLHPGKCYTTFVLREQAIEHARELRLTLSAGSLGGDGVVRLRVPITRP